MRNREEMVRELLRLQGEHGDTTWLEGVLKDMSDESIGRLLDNCEASGFTPEGIIDNLCKTFLPPTWEESRQ